MTSYTNRLINAVKYISKHCNKGNDPYIDFNITGIECLDMDNPREAWRFRKWKYQINGYTWYEVTIKNGFNILSTPINH